MAASCGTCASCKDHLEQYCEADKCADVKRDCEREGLRELDRDPADDWMREAYLSAETYDDYIKRLLAKAEVTAYWEPAS